LSQLQGTIGADPIHGGLEATRQLRAPGGQQQIAAFTN